MARNAGSLPAPAGVDTGTLSTEASRDPRVEARLGRRRFRSHLPPVRLHTFDSFTYRNFRLLWALAISAAAMALQEVVIGWLTYDLARSPFLISMALGLGGLPVLRIGPRGGLMVDSFDRRKLLALSSAYQVAVTLGFALIVIFNWVAPGNILGFALLAGLPWVVGVTRRCLARPLFPALASSWPSAFGLRRLIARGYGSAPRSPVCAREARA